MQIDYKEAESFIRNCEDVYILIHQSPDGDTIGTGFAMHYLLNGLHKRSKVICPDEIPERYSFMIKNNKDYGEFEPKCIIAVDIADINLLGKNKEIYADKVDFCLDHHISNTGYAKRVLLNPKAAAACEVMYELIKSMGEEITEDIARCLYVGISTDTGCFKFENTTARTHEIAAEIMKNHNLPYALINRKMFDIKSIGRIHLEMKLFERMQSYLDGKCNVIVVTKQFMDELSLTGDDLEGVTSIPLQIEGVEIGVTIKEKEPDVFKVSMRSADKANVSEICQKFGGGGHAKAAGCLVKAPIDESVSLIVNAIKEGLDKI